MVCQIFACRQASARTARPSSMMRPDSSARGMNVSGGMNPRVGWCPAGERFEGDDVAGMGVDDGLVVHGEGTVSRERRVALARGPCARPPRCASRSRRRDSSPLPSRFARYIAASALLRRDSASLSGRSASAMPILAPIATSRSGELQWLFERVEDTLRDASGLVGRIEIVDEDRELVTAEPRDRVEVAERACRSGSRLRSGARRRPGGRDCRSRS